MRPVPATTPAAAEMKLRRLQNRRSSVISDAEMSSGLPINMGMPVSGSM
jgi:hypothetical protein